MKGISDTSETLGWHYKRRGNQQLKAFNNNESERKDPWENSVRIQKGGKGGKHHLGSWNSS